VIETLYNIITSLLEEVTEGSHPDDMVRLLVFSPSLDYPISLPFMKKKYVTAATLLDQIERVQQSYEFFSIHGALTITVTIAAMPRGTGWKERSFITSKWLNDKKSVVTIRNHDELCGARAVVTGMARVLHEEEQNQVSLGNFRLGENGKAKGVAPNWVDNDALLSDMWGHWESIRDGRNIQGQLAHRLVQEAGVGYEGVSLEELKTIQDKALTPRGFQLKVLSKPHLNGIVYAGPENVHQIYLYHSDNHFDVITKIAGFVAKQYYCTHCDVGYSHETKHRCEVVCQFCYGKNCSSKPEAKVHCPECNRYFRHQNCLQNHLSVPQKGQTVCFKIKRCTLGCSRLLPTLKRQQNHVCNEVY
jgi:hypothetical protein